ncbi:MAG: hypothetical protein PHU14_03295 [Methylovulum sp.]|nr:hypothetical protein [Methylovulum sp.]
MKTYQHIEKNWNIEAIVSELRLLRNQALESRQRKGRPPKLPSRKALVGVLENLSAALFPNRLGSGELSDESIDYFVGHTLDVALQSLFEQLRRECRFKAEQQGLFDIDCSQHAVIINREFAAQLPTIRALLDSDLIAAYEGDPAATSLDEVLVCYPGMTAIIYHRSPCPVSERLAAGRPHDCRNRPFGDWHRHPPGRGHRRQLFHRPRHWRGDWRNGGHRPACPRVSGRDLRGQAFPQR